MIKICSKCNQILFKIDLALMLISGFDNKRLIISVFAFSTAIKSGVLWIKTKWTPFYIIISKLHWNLI